MLLLLLKQLVCSLSTVIPQPQLNDIVQIQSLPILGICGTSASGRSALIDHTIRRIKDKGLQVVAVKDIGNELVELSELARECDLILVDGGENTTIPNIRLVAGNGNKMRPSSKYGLAVFPKANDCFDVIDKFVDDFLVRRWLKPPVVGCVLIGGNSTRMGCPKHLLKKDGKFWIEHTIDLLSRVTDQIVVVGKGELPENNVTRLADIHRCHGPLSGVLAACRQYPWSSLLVCACDLPDLTKPALEWLLAQRVPGAWSILPKNGGHYEPLLALYDFRMGAFFERMFSEGKYRLSAVASAQNVQIVEPPTEMRPAWRNVNYADQIIG